MQNALEPLPMIRTGDIDSGQFAACIRMQLQLLRFLHLPFRLTHAGNLRSINV
jgi:hypothetical protein